MSVINATPLLAAAGGEYEISRSVRLRSSASAYFNRTPSASNRTTWTWSGWVKRGALSFTNGNVIFGAYDNASATDATYTAIGFNANDTLFLSGWTTVWRTTTAVYRDPSAWYHIVVAVDTTQATAANRIAVYVNGVAINAFSNNNNPTQNQQLGVNAAQVHTLGRVNYLSGTGPYPFDGYLTEVNFIDGQALTPSSFGETDSITGVWKPKKYAGTYGTNGFYLNFSDNSSNTATTIGKDNSGNGNNWTPNNISVTSGVTYDSMLDVPTMYADGGNGRGNYPVLNPLYNTGTLGYLPTRNANLTVYDSSGDANWRSRWATIGMTSGKWYAEFPITYSGSASVSSAGAIAIGLHDGGSASYVGKTSTTYGYFANATRHNNSSPVSYGATYANGDIIGVAYDADAGTLTFYKNGTSQGVAYSSIPAGTYFFAVSAFWVSPDGNTTINANFGQRPFAYTPPTGFKALNTQNLPDATIKKGNAYFDVSLYTGNGTSQSIVNAAGFQPDLVWGKSRSGASTSNWFEDSVRGAGQVLYSDQTVSEQNNATFLPSINSNGFSVAGNTSFFNASGATFVGWQWKESVSAGFDIVTYTGTGVARTVAHNLGVAPSMMIVKSRSSGADGWPVYHSSVGNLSALVLNSTGAINTNSVWWNNTSPTSSVFTVGTNSGVNANAATYVAYLFAEVAGYSKFGSYTGNGSTDGPFVYLGFRPRFVMLKVSSSSPFGWLVYDSSRDTYNVTDLNLRPNLSDAESSQTANYLDFLSNGFKIRGDSSGSINPSQTVIYAAFAENPFKNSLAR